MSDVQLTISKEIVTPIVEAKIKEAILSALGGGDVLIARVVEGVLHQKVDREGKVSTYSSDNKFDWIEITLNQEIKKQVEVAIREVLAINSSAIKDAIVDQLQSKKGSSKAASALVDCMLGTFKNTWTSRIEIGLEKRPDSG